MPFGLFNKKRSRKRSGPAKRKTTPTLQTQVRQWAQDQIANGVPRQDVVNQLYKKTTTASHSKRPTLEHIKQLEAYNTVANEIFNVMVNRNLKGRAHEKADNVTAAIRLYKANVKDRFDGTHPYNRLRIIYTQQKRYDDAVHVCQAYLDLPDREHGQNKPHFQHHLERLHVKAASQS